MVFGEKVIGLITENDFKNAIITDTNFTFVDGAVSLNAGECTYLSSEYSFWAKGQDTSHRAYVSIPIYPTSFGDMIEIEFEYFNISGATVQCSLVDLSVDYNTGSFGTINFGQINTTITGRWDRINVKIPYMSRKKMGRVDIGNFLADDYGEFKLRNVIVKHYAQQRNDMENTNIRLFTLKKGATTWELHSSIYSDICTISVDSEAKNITINFSNMPNSPTMSNYRPLPFISIDGSSSGADSAAYAKVSTPTNNSLLITLWTPDNALLDPMSGWLSEGYPIYVMLIGKTVPIPF